MTAVAIQDQEEAARRSREQAAGLLAAFDTALDPILVVDDKRRYVHVNEAACTLFGYSREQILGKRLEELVPDANRKEAVAIWVAFLRRGQMRGEIELRRADGSTVVAEYSATANFVPDRHLTVLRDVTIRSRTEQELRESHRQLQETQALAMVGSWGWDLGSDLRITSAEMLRILGRPPESEALSYEEFVKYIHPEDRAAYDKVAETALREKQPFHQVFRIISDAGETRTIESHGTVEVNEAGEPVRMLGAAQDITERERAEHDLRLQANVLDQVPAGVIAAGLHRMITYWSHGAEVLFGVARAEALGSHFDELGLIPPESRVARAAMAAQLARGKSWEGEIELRDRAGRTFPALVTDSPVHDGRGEIESYVGVIVDLTEPQRAQEEARAARLETIERLAIAVVKRDPETGGHIERIGDVAAMIAERLGMEPERVELIRVASRMHDVGKIGIADDILLKPGPLTDEERAVMQTHAASGHDILAGSGADVLDLAAEIALTHHERIDGTGYPRGLSGDDIPIEGRIVAVADVFDALTSDRCYRKAFSLEKTVEIMKEGRGTQFDPAILDVLLDSL